MTTNRPHRGQPRSPRTAPADLAPADLAVTELDPTAVLADLTRTVGTVLQAMDWAEDEIRRATARHPTQADLLYHGFGLLVPNGLSTRMVEFVYRAHATELLDRLAARGDTRPATAAEMCVACCGISQRLPLHGPAAGLYLTLWQQAFPDRPAVPDLAAQVAHHAAMHGDQIAELRTTMARKLASPDRRLGPVACAGRHHGIATPCRFTTSPGHTRSGARPGSARGGAGSSTTG